MASESKTPWLLYVVGFLYFAVSNLSRMLQLAGVPREATYVLFLAVLAVYFVQNIKSLAWFDGLYYLAVGCVVLAGLSNYGEYIESQASVFSVTVLFLPAYLFFRLFSEREDVFKKCFVAAGWFAAVYLLPYYVLIVRRNYAYSMSYAYWASFPICVLTHRFLETRKLAPLCLGGILYVTVVLAGCRGALLLSSLCMAVEVAQSFGNAKWTPLRCLAVLLGVFLVTLLIVNIDSLLAFLARYSGMSRNIRKFLQGNYFESSAREAIYVTCRQLLDNHPEGYGSLSSRLLLLGQNYPHSLWYELQLDFGQIIGIGLFLALATVTVANMLAFRKTELALPVNYLAIVGMGSLMISSSYYYEMYVPAMVGLFVHRFIARNPRSAAVLDPGRLASPPSSGKGELQ